MATSNIFIYVALLFAAAFTAFNIYTARRLPLLAELFSIMLSVAAAYSGIELCYAVLEGTRKLGDFQDQKLIIVLGSIAVFWVSLLTVVNLVKGVSDRAKLSTPGESEQMVENA